jgi:hypothetical protein
LRRPPPHLTTPRVGGEESLPVTRKLILKADEIIWSPPEWSCNCFPLPHTDHEVLELEYVVDAMQRLVDTVTEADTTGLGRSLHVGHMLTSMQSAEGNWPALFNARTGEWIGDERSVAPIPLLRRMNAMLNSTEFDHVIRRAGG